MIADTDKPGQNLLSISAVERDTGLTKDTLRVWERRYQFPLPARDQNGERAYTAQQVEKLRALKRLIDRGHRPSKIIDHSIDELLRLIELPGAAPEPSANPMIDALVELVRTHRVIELRRELGQVIMRQGLAAFLVQTVGPLTRAIGDGWMRGNLEVFEEHLYTETMQSVLRGAIATLPQPDRRPRVLLATFPNELHGLGLLMAEGMLGLEGASCLALGTHTPIYDIAAAATSEHADVVALSFSLSYPVNLATEGLEELRSKVSREVEIWAGGTNPGLARRPVPGVVVMSELADIPSSVARWRADHPDA